MRFIKKNSKYIGIVMVCIFCSYLTTIATNYAFDSGDVRFDNTGTSLESVNVQDAIDETFHHVTDYNEIKTTIGNSTLTTTNQTLTGGINEVNSNLGLPSSASGVTGADAFSKINTLNSKIATKKVTNIATGITLWRSGNIITINCKMNNVTTAGTWGTIFTLPEEYRPSEQLQGFYDPYNNIRIIINDFGEVQLANIVTNASIRFTLTYIIE